MLGQATRQMCWKKLMFRSPVAKVKPPVMVLPVLA